MIYELQLIEWVDSFGCSSTWSPTDSIKEDIKPYICTSVGFVVFENDSLVVVVPHIAPEDKELGSKEQGCGDMAIPKSAILKRKTLQHRGE